MTEFQQILIKTHMLTFLDIFYIFRYIYIFCLVRKKLYVRI